MSRMTTDDIRSAFEAAGLSVAAVTPHRMSGRELVRVDVVNGDKLLGRDIAVEPDGVDPALVHQAINAMADALK